MSNVVFLDIDGTIVDRNGAAYIGFAHLKEWLSEMASNGLEIGICTNRPWASAAPYVSDLGITGPIICEGGAVFVTGGQPEISPNAVFDIATVDRAIKEVVAGRSNTVSAARNEKGRIATATIRVGGTLPDARGFGVALGRQLGPGYVIGIEGDTRVTLRPASSTKYDAIARHVPGGIGYLVTDDEDVPEDVQVITVAVANATADLKKNAHYCAADVRGNGLCDCLRWIASMQAGMAGSLTNELSAYGGTKYLLSLFVADDATRDVRQVSGYLRNQSEEVLIVKGKRGWTFPGGKPRKGETFYQTLVREVAEESGQEVASAIYAMYVRAYDFTTGTAVSQVRYVGEVAGVRDFVPEFETSERAYIPLGRIPDYIPWHAGRVFGGELGIVKKEWYNKG